ncbi:MAG: HAD-IA family hydrolase [Cyanophyceae cyanobacterium]
MPPTVIFLDAVGTLFGIRGSVGEIYSAIASQAGVEVSPHRLDQAFVASFKAAPRLAFPGVNSAQIPAREFQWWQTVTRTTFEQVGVLDRFADFNRFFTSLYGHFATAHPWFVYPDVVPALTAWQQQGIELGIISNFDTRLYQVLEHLQLKHFFSSITVSSRAGAAKPASSIFAAALRQHRCSPHQAWHVGDSQAEDYQGAEAAGLRPFLLQRSATPDYTLKNISQLV